MTQEPEITRLLEQSQAGDEQASARLMPLIYDELRGLAANFMRSERPDHTLQPTALVHEAYVRLVHGSSTFANRAHFFAAAATAVRRILVEHARSRRNRPKVQSLSSPTDPQHAMAVESPEHVLAVDEALSRLTAQNPHLGRLVELRFFGGLTTDEIADAMKTSRRTIARDWLLAKAWLSRELGESASPDA